MTDKEKLQKLFDAAMKAPDPTPQVALQRAFPQGATSAAPPVAATPVPVPVVSPVVEAPSPAVAEAPNPQVAVLDDAASTELGALLDEQIARGRSKRKRDALVTALVLFGMTGGSFAWFVQSPERVEAVRSAMREIRSVGDVKSLVAKYQAALDKIGARSQQIDQATAAMGVTKTAADDVDPNLDAEMKEMMGGEGKTTGQRNAALQQAFGDRAKEGGGTLKAEQGLTQEDSFAME